MKAPVRRVGHYLRSALSTPPVRARWSPRGAGADEEGWRSIREWDRETMVLDGRDEVGRVGYLELIGETTEAVVERVSGDGMTVRYIDPTGAFLERLSLAEARRDGRERAPARGLVGQGIAELQAGLERKIEAQIDTVDPLIPLADHPWTEALIARAPAIRREAEGVLERFAFDELWFPGEFQKRPGWRLFPVAFAGGVSPVAAELTPVTASVCARVPALIGANFSFLAPGEHIRLHRAGTRANLRCHLGVIIPPGDTALHVDGEDLRWREGEVFIFDDGKYHGAWNRTAGLRVVLIIDFLRPLTGWTGSLIRSSIPLFTRQVTASREAWVADAMPRLRY